MQYPHTLFAEDPLRVEIRRIQRPAHLAGAVVPDPYGAQSESGIGDVELVPPAPRAVLRHFFCLIADVPLSELCLDKGGDRAARHKPGKRQTLHTERGGDVEHVCFGAGGLHIEHIAVVDSHPVRGRDAYTHTGGACDSPAGVFSDLYIHTDASLILLS